MKLTELHEEDDLKRKHFGDLLVKVMYKELKPVLTDWMVVVGGHGWIPESITLPGAKYYHENLSYSDTQDSAEAFARDYFNGIVHYMDKGSLHPTRDDTIVFMLIGVQHYSDVHLSFLANL